MGSTRSRSEASVRTGTSLPVSKLYPSVINKDSKAQNVLGLSRTELYTARSESLKPNSKSRSHRISPDKSYAYSTLAWARGKLVGVSVQEFEPEAASTTYTESLGRGSDAASLSQATSLKRYSSTAPQRSFYDAATAPLRVSQQTSNSSSRDFALRKGHPAVVASKDQEMERSRQGRLVKPARLRKTETTFSPMSRRSSISTSMNKLLFVSQVSSLSTTPMPTSPQQTGANRLPFDNAQEKPARLDQMERVSIENVVSRLNSPYAKINVRRPKVGTKHWFDDLEDISSDEEQNERPVVEQHSAIDTEHSSEDGWIGTTAFVADYAKHADQKTGQACVTEIAELPANAEAPPSKPKKQRKVSEQSLNTPPIRLRSSHPLTQADLSHESVLHLSASEDEHEEEEADVLQPLQPVQSLGSGRGIRDSLSLETSDSDFEIGLAHAIKATDKRSSNRSSPIRLVTTRTASSSSRTSVKELRVVSRATGFTLGSDLDDGPEVEDCEEDVLLSSFPATPTDANRPRSSISLSDDRSIVSMRLMKVTRQEENLIAAMRMKRAAMKKAEKTTAHRKASKSKKAPEKLIVPLRRSSLTEHNEQQSDFVVSPSTPISKNSSYSPRSDDSPQDNSQPATAFVPDLHGTRNSDTPLLSRLSDEYGQRDSLSTQSSRGLLSRSRTSPARHSFGLFPRPQSSALTGQRESQRRNSNIIVLDNLNSTLSSPTFPSQLFLDSPFAAWERSDSAAVHQVIQARSAC